ARFRFLVAHNNSDGSDEESGDADSAAYFAGCWAINRISRQRARHRQLVSGTRAWHSNRTLPGRRQIRFRIDRIVRSMVPEPLRLAAVFRGDRRRAACLAATLDGFSAKVGRKIRE